MNRTSVAESPPHTEAELQTEGVLPAQLLRRAVTHGWIHSPTYMLGMETIQPASIDLRLGDCAYALRCSFLPDSDSTVGSPAETWVRVPPGFDIRVVKKSA